jgi:hypothetical protein
MNEEKPTRRAAARVCYCMSIRCWRPTVATVATARASVSPSASPPVVVAAARSLPRPSSAQLSRPCTALKLASKARRNSILSQIMPVVRPRSLLSLSRPTHAVTRNSSPPVSFSRSYTPTVACSSRPPHEAWRQRLRKGASGSLPCSAKWKKHDRACGWPAPPDWLVGQSDDAGRGNPRALALALSW